MFDLEKRCDDILSEQQKTMNIKIRKMKVEDISSIGLLVEQTLGKSDAVKAKQDMLDQSNELYVDGSNFVALIEGEVVGLIGYWKLKHHPQKVVWLDWFAVSHEYQSKGIGSKLLSHMVDYLKKKKYQMLCCEKSSKDTKADYFYAKHQFVEFGRMKNYWDDKGDLILLVKSL